MGRIIAALVLLLLGAPAWAQSLQGQWHVRVPAHAAYVGVVLVDSQNRATWDSPSDHGRPAKYRGYVATLTGGNAELLFTDGLAVVRTVCQVQSSDLLHCYHRFKNGTTSEVFALARVGAGPVSLIMRPD